MDSITINGGVWLTRTVRQGGIALRQGRVRANEGVAARVLGTAVVAAGLCLVAAASGVPGEPALASNDTKVAPRGKDESRIAAAPVMRAALPAAAAAASPPRIPDLRVAPTEAGFRRAAIDPAAAVAAAARFTLVPGAPVTAAPASANFSDSWNEEELARAEALDGRTLSSGPLVIRLDGIALPDPEQVCRTLDGRLEPCVTRAMTQLELLTRWRKVTCRYRMTASHEAVGQCRIGDSDLAERMLRTGYVSRMGVAQAAAPAPRG